MKAVYPGSFDPITNGHLDIIERASQIFDKLVVAVLDNVDKTTVFSVEDRLQMIQSTLNKDLNLKSKVEVVSFSGLAVELAKSIEADSFIRGMRDIGDFRFEWEAALLNKKLGNVDTLFLMTDPIYAFISSSRVREIARLGGDVSNWVPRSVQKFLSKLN
ncbi:MAG: pantetheine-phosphate adenylyltransferase [Candidatus Caenarcaniphilales bacterium]|nr:pantetheine-phosphate adenylyltransferase [Candidatus Caenarcaniphilales bacterium]